MILLPLLLLPVFACVASDKSIKNPVVLTKYGSLKGYVYNSPASKQATNVFLGIPFAKPPIGEFRFQKSQPPEPWEGVKDATKFGPMCIQQMEMPAEVADSEDCLTLNVMTPQQPEDSTKPLAVMVWIHGGAFIMGSSSAYGVNGLCDYMVSKSVVIVSINYRLGLLGFLSVSRDSAAGNYGIHDQVAALKWVSENIKVFGGDPNRVTLFGESAGGMSVSLLSVIPKAQPYFHATIMQSGSAMTEFCLSDNPKKASRVALRRCGCVDGSDKENVDCMRNQNVTQLRQAATFKKTDDDHVPIESPFLMMELSFAPVVVNGHLIPMEAEQLMRQVDLKPAIIGVTRTEMATFLAPLPNIKQMMESFGATFIESDKYNETFFKEYLTKAFIHLPDNQANAAVDAGMKLYLGRNPTKATIFEQFVNYQSDLVFNMPAADEMQARRSLGAKTYMYIFDHYSPTIFPESFPLKSSQHGFDIPILFNTSLGFLDFEWTKADTRVRDHMTTMWTNFAKYHDPTPNDVPVDWKEVEKDEVGVNTLIIAEELKLSTNFFNDRHSYWNSVKFDKSTSDKHAEL